jgi:HK97 family phage major capsid protein
MTKPLVPEDVGRHRARPSVYLARAACAHIKSHLTRESPMRCAAKMFGDSVTELVLRGAAAPTMTSVPSWAGVLAQQTVDDTIAELAALFAAPDIINRGTKVKFDSAGSIRFPGRVAPSATDAGSWLAEGQPIPVRQQTFTSGVVLAPRKLGVLVTMSREQAESSNLEAISRALISEALGMALDVALFSNFAGDATRPPGILAGVTPITTTSGGGMNALATDIGNLIGALAAANAGKNVVFVTAAKQAASLKLLAGANFDYPVIASTALAAGTVIAMEISSFISAFAPVPEFEVSKAATLHMSDTPTDVVAGTPTKSMFTVDSIALRMVLSDVSWGVRAPGHVQVIVNTTW